jgi:transcriptional regulator with XRE-family HTH domain
MTPRQFLGDELRRARIAAGFTSQQALADRLGFDRSVIAKTESGERPPSVEVLAAWCAATGIDPEHYTRLCELARSADGPIPTWFESWVEAERHAHTLRTWQPLIIPGLLQIPAYMRELFIAHGNDEIRTEELTNARLERQTVLDGLEPPELTVVLDEMVLRKLIGSPSVMHDQLLHVAELSRRPNIMVHVLPADLGANPGLGGALNLASCDGAPEVLLTEAVEDQPTESRSTVRKAALVFGRVQADSLPRAQSRSLILEVADQWKQQITPAGASPAVAAGTAAPASKLASVPQQS